MLYLFMQNMKMSLMAKYSCQKRRMEWSLKHILNWEKSEGNELLLNEWHSNYILSWGKQLRCHVITFRNYIQQAVHSFERGILNTSSHAQNPKLFSLKKKD